MSLNGKKFSSYFMKRLRKYKATDSIYNIEQNSAYYSQGS